MDMVIVLLHFKKYLHSVGMINLLLLPIRQFVSSLAVLSTPLVPAL